MFLAIISYDVSTRTLEGQRRLRRVARACEDYGQRVQNSVFECWLSTETLLLLRSRIVAEMDATEDSVRIYLLEQRCRAPHGRVD